MSRFSFLRLLPLLALSALAGAATVDVAPDDASVRLLGRTTLDKATGTVRWSWSGSGASIAFTGTSCAVRLKSPGAFFRILVDGKETGTLDLTNKQDTLYPLASGLAQGTHTVTLRQRTEASYSIAEFHGFRIEGVPGTAPAGSERRIEFYGNSITCGYGILATDANQPFKTETEDEGRTFAAQASDSLGAERRTICWSGKGVVQNYGGDTQYPTLPQLSDRVVPSETGNRQDFTGWVPQVVVIDLGTNDYSTASKQPDSAKFYRTYLAFVDTLHVRYPKARFVLVDGPMMSDGYPAGLNTLSKLKKHIDNIIADVSKRGIQATHLSLTPQGNLGYGADWHPSLAQSALNAKELVVHLRTAAGWDDPSGIRRARPARPRAALHRHPAGWAVRIAGADTDAAIRDASGRALWRETLPAGVHTLPETGNGRWLVLAGGRETRVLPLQVSLR